MNRRWFLSVLFLVAVLSLPGGGVGAQDEPVDRIEPILVITVPDQIWSKHTTEHAFWNADETHILYWNSEGAIHVWDAISGEEILDLSLEPGEQHVEDVRWSADGKRILALSYRVEHENDSDPSFVYVAHKWSAVTGELTSTDSVNVEYLATDVVWSADENHVLISNPFGNVGQPRVWDISKGTVLILADVRWADWNRDGSRILSWDHGLVKIWNVYARSELLVLPGAEWGRWNTNGNLVVIKNGDVLQVRNAIDGSLLVQLYHPQASGAAWSPDGTRLVSYSYDSGIVNLWSIESGQNLLAISYSHVWDVWWSVDGSRIYARGDCNNNILAWDASTGEELYVLRHMQTEVTPGGICDGIVDVWSTDENRILTWTTYHNEDRVRVWNAETGQELVSIRDSSKEEGRMDRRDSRDWGWWNADGKHFLSVLFSTGEIKVWVSEEGKELITLHHNGEIEGVAWNVDGTRLLSWGFGEIKIWAIPTD